MRDVQFTAFLALAMVAALLFALSPSSGSYQANMLPAQRPAQLLPAARPPPPRLRPTPTAPRHKAAPYAGQPAADPGAGAGGCPYPMWSIPGVGTDTRCDDVAGCPKRLKAGSDCDDAFGVVGGHGCEVQCAGNRGRSGPTETWACSAVANEAWVPPDPAGALTCAGARVSSAPMLTEPATAGGEAALSPAVTLVMAEDRLSNPTFAASVAQKLGYARPHSAAQQPAPLRQ